jgi:hypothetical protein
VRLGIKKGHARQADVSSTCFNIDLSAWQGGETVINKLKLADNGYMANQDYAASFG